MEHRSLRFIATGLMLMPLLANSAGASFPGAMISWSPDKRWQASSVPPTSDEGHRLNLKSSIDGSTREVLKFPRQIDLLWSPDSQTMAVTDYVGSDSSDCLIVDVVTLRMQSIAQAIQSSVLEPAIEGNHHSYVKCLKWLSKSIVEIRVQAYGDRNPQGVMKRARFDITKNAITVENK